MSKLYSEYLKRENSLMGLIGNILPDPDKILEENGNDLSIYKDLLVDPHLTATILQRKMQVLQMGWEVESESEQLRNEGIEIMRSFPLQEIISQMLDSVLFGFSVSEIIWELRQAQLPNGMKRIVPKEIIAKPQEWFSFDNENELKIIDGAKQSSSRNLLGGRLVAVPMYKFILSRHQPTFDNPYGEKILQRCYWPVKLKQSSIESWNELIEKYGVPYLIGVVSDTATQAEKEAVIYDLLDMIENNVVTRGESQQIEIKEQTSYDIGRMFEKMVEFQNKEISKAVLSVTLTIDVGTSGSYKASDVHRQMLEYIGISDKKIVESGLNQMFDYYTELNYGTSTSLSNRDKKIRVKLSKKEAITDETAERDKILSEIGIKFSKEYFMKKYNLGDEDFELEKP
jgi:phage gp29-like protein